MDDSYSDGVGLFNEPGAIDLVLLISREKEINTTAIRSLTGNYDRLKSLVWVMRDRGLVDIERIDRPRLKYTIRLTDKGRKAAELLERLDQEMRS